MNHFFIIQLSNHLFLFTIAVFRDSTAYLLLF